MSLPEPISIRRANDATLEITWSDGTVRTYSVRSLRDGCPCATCREKRDAPAAPGQLTILRPEETRPLRIDGMRPVGRYAYNITFSDGHDTGIYTLESLWHWPES